MKNRSEVEVEGSLDSNRVNVYDQKHYKLRLDSYCAATIWEECGGVEH